MAKSKRNVSKKQSKVPTQPPVPPPPLRETKSSPSPPPPLKPAKTSTVKEFSSETNSTHHPSEKSSSVAQVAKVAPSNKVETSTKVAPSNRVETSTKVKGAKSKKGKNLSPQKTIQDSDSSKSDQQPTFISKASWIPQQSPTQDDAYVSESDPAVNKVYFFDEQDCSDPDDEFLFTCCVPPYSSRYPPNPRPRRLWDPSVLPTGTNIPTSIGKPCKRCGQWT
ncbi:unnamed protein product [Orchesella dallaii]|uniref:Uncharacterized protein n=1 Tax=Orchesella dallaii TaxID=48710 RepID=A0ABP1PTQ5_9HEXA